MQQYIWKDNDKVQKEKKHHSNSELEDKVEEE